MKRIALILLFFISCTTAPSVFYDGDVNDDGKWHGKGVVIFPNGEVWEGEFKDGEPFNGKGVYVYPDKSKYGGNIINGERNGQGTITFSDGTKYVGEFKDGRSNGYGTLTLPYGATKYAGEFKDGRSNGQGTLTHSDGTKYVGEWKDGRQNGQGTYTWSNGTKYAGQWKDNKRDGIGTHTTVDGTKYVGEWKDGKKNDKGVLFNVSGEIQSGIWVNDSFKDVWTTETVENFLKNKYPQFKGLNYEIPTPSVTLQKNNITSITPSEKSVFIAVLDFDGKGVTNVEASALSDRLRLELFSTKRFTVVERAMMEQILVEQGFQQSGCTTNECIVEVGQLIGVEQIVGGSISKVGRTYSVSARLVSVETGKILKTATYDFRGEIDDLLVSGMKQVSLELAK